VLGAVLTAFGLVLVAELGDKTQLVVLTMGAGRRVGPTLAGLLATIALLQAIAVGAGSLVAQAVSERTLGIASGLLFVGFAAWTWWSTDDDGEADGAPPGSLWSFLGAFFLAELGDKSSLATAVLATTNNAWGTWIGATLGFFAATVVSLAAGNFLRARIRPTTLRQLGAAAFLVAGVATLVTTLT
jgi:putative Ca2+/H+ antiporter (TMEM165/GDT1 family)